jgi:hypothetical protein
MSSGRDRAGTPASCYRLFLLLFAPFYQVDYLFSGLHSIIATRHRNGGYDTIMAILALRG